MTTTSDRKIDVTVDGSRETGPLEDTVLATLREWDPLWARQCLEVSANPWTNGILPRKTVELVGLAVSAACTNLDADGSRRHIRGALEAGATRDEILMVLRMAWLLSIHTCSLAAPILLEEAKAAGVQPTPKEKGATPICDKMKAVGQWNTAWDPFFELGLDRSVHRRRRPGLRWERPLAQTGRAAEHCFRCVGHSHVRSRHAPAHQSGPEARRHD